MSNIGHISSQCGVPLMPANAGTGHMRVLLLKECLRLICIRSVHKDIKIFQGVFILITWEHVMRNNLKLLH